MEMKLAENIRRFRKQRGLTQEQLAEVLGVTVGAVHKWEKNLSAPELRLIAEMADFFDVSVDVLLGYEMKDNSLKAVLERLTEYINAEDPEGPAEAEKALRRFPHSFDVVYLSAIMYMIFGGKNHSGEQLDRASVLLEKSLLLLPQNTNPGISEISIYEYMANVQIMQGRGDRAAELLKEHNREGVYDALIGMTFSMMCARPDEAQPFLSKAMLDTLAQMVMTVLSKAHAYALGGDQDSAESLLKWGIEMLEGLKQPEVTGYLDQACSFLNLELAYVYLRKENGAQARKAMKRCLELADRFDGSPNYDARSVRFIDGGEHFFMHIILGRTVRESIEYLVHLFADEPLDALWKEMTGNE